MNWTPNYVNLQVCLVCGVVERSEVSNYCGDRAQTVKILCTIITSYKVTLLYIYLCTEYFSEDLRT